jgi:beta-glucosidase
MTTPAYRDPSLPAEDRVADLLGRMSLEEKVAQMSSVWLSSGLDGKHRDLGEVESAMRQGIGQVTRVVGSAPIGPAEGAALANRLQRFLVEETRLGVPAIVHEECLAGLMACEATAFPQAIGLASTFDPDLIARVTGVIRRQTRSVGAQQGLAPVLDVARDPRWGRIEETFGEDPYLVARIGAAYVRGLQGDDPSSGVMATLKHFAGYSFGEGGRNLAPAHVGPRELRDAYLFPFEVAVREAGAASVMNAYQEIDGIPVAASRELLTGILRGEWGFEGLVVADYYSIDFLRILHRVAEDEGEAARLALRAGIDVELPDRKCYDEPLVSAVRDGRIAEQDVDAVVRRVLTWKVRLGLFERPYVDPEEAANGFDTDEDRSVALEVARRSIVLLRNTGDLLPLDRPLRSIAVIGPNADHAPALFGDYSMTNHLRIDEPTVPAPTLLDAVRALAPSGVSIRTARGCEVEGGSRGGFEEAVRAARESDVAIVVIGDRSGALVRGTVGEHRDSDTLELPGLQDDLVRAVHGTGTPVVVVLLNGRPYATGWIAENVPAVVEAWFPGEEGGRAVAEVLFGRCNPSGKLPVTVPRRGGQAPIPYNTKFLSRKDYVDSAIAPLFPFGHGLSYTRFEYDGLAVEPDSLSPDGTVEIRCRVSNAGERAGTEVVQLYVKDPVASCTRPVQELKGFYRVSLEPGATKTVCFSLPTDLLAFHDADLRLVVEPGDFEVRVGASSEDIRLRGSFRVVGDVRVIEGQRRYETAVREEGGNGDRL